MHTRTQHMMDQGTLAAHLQTGVWEVYIFHAETLDARNVDRNGAGLEYLKPSQPLTQSQNVCFFISSLCFLQRYLKTNIYSKQVSLLKEQLCAGWCGSAHPSITWALAESTAYSRPEQCQWQMVTLLGSGCNAVVWWCADSLSPEEGSSLETSWGKIPSPTFSQKWRCLQFSPKWKKTKSETTFFQSDIHLWCRKSSLLGDFLYQLRNGNVYGVSIYWITGQIEEAPNVISTVVSQQRKQQRGELCLWPYPGFTHLTMGFFLM